MGIEWDDHTGGTNRFFKQQTLADLDSGIRVKLCAYLKPPWWWRHHGYRCSCWRPWPGNSINLNTMPFRARSGDDLAFDIHRLIGIYQDPVEDWLATLRTRMTDCADEKSVSTLLTILGSRIRESWNRGRPGSMWWKHNFLKWSLWYLTLKGIWYWVPGIHRM